MLQQQHGHHTSKHHVHDQYRYDITNLVIMSLECADDLLELIADVQPAGAKQSVLFDTSKPAQTPLSSLKSLATRQKAEFRQAQNDYRLAVSCAAGALLPQDP